MKHNLFKKTFLLTAFAFLIQASIASFVIIYVTNTEIRSENITQTDEVDTTVEGGLTKFVSNKWGTSSEQTLITASAGIQGISVHTYIGSTLFEMPINQNEDWGIPQNDLFHLYFASWASASGAECGLVGYKFASSAKINLTMKDTVIDNFGISHVVSEIYGIAGGETSDRGIFSYSEKKVAYDYACKQLYGFSSNNIMTYLPDRAFYFCSNLKSVHLGRNMSDPKTNASHSSYIFGCISTLSPSLISVDPLNTNLKIKQCKVNNVIGTAILQNNSSNAVFGNTLCAGAINASELFVLDAQGHIKLPITAFDSSWSITSINLNKVNDVGERCFYNCPYIEDVYLYDSEYSEWTWRLGTGTFGSGRGEFGFYYPYVTTNHNEDYTASGTDGALNWRTIIHLPSSTTDAQLTTWRLHYRDQKIASDSNGMFGLEKPEQIVIDQAGDHMEIVGPQTVTTRSEMLLTNWHGQVYLSSGDFATSNFLWSISGLTGGSINESTGYITAPINNFTYDVTYSNVTITAVSLDDTNLSATMTITIIVKGTSNIYTFDLLGTQYIEANFSDGANSSYVISKGTSIYVYDRPEWNIQFNAGSPTTNGININQNGLLTISQTVQAKTYVVTIAVASHVTGNFDEVLYSELEVTIVINGKDIIVDAPTELEYFYHDGLHQISIFADYNIFDDKTTINWLVSSPGISIKSTGMGREATLNINTNVIQPGQITVTIIAYDDSGVETFHIIELTINNINIHVEGQSFFEFNKYRGGSTGKFIVIRGQDEVQPDSWIVEYFTGDSWSNNLPTGITWNENKFTVGSTAVSGMLLLRITATYGTIVSDSFELSINIMTPVLTISGNSIIAVQYSYAQTQTYDGSLSLPVDDSGDDTYTWSLGGKDKAFFAGSSGIGDIFTLSIPNNLISGTPYNISIIATPNDESLSPITVEFPVQVNVEEFSMNTTATSSNKGLTGMTLYSVYGVEKTVKLSTTTSLLGEITTYESVGALPAGITLTNNGQITFSDNLKVNTESGYYQLQIKITGSTPQRNTVVNFIVRTMQSNVEITSSTNRTFIDGIGGAVNFTSSVTPSNPAYALANQTLWNVVWTNNPSGLQDGALPTGFTTTNIDNPTSTMSILLSTNAHTGIYSFSITAIANNETDAQLSQTITATYTTSIFVNSPTINILSPNSENTLTNYRGMNWQPHRFNAVTVPTGLSQIVDWKFAEGGIPAELIDKTLINKDSGVLTCLSSCPVGTYQLTVQASRHDDPHVFTTHTFTLNILMPELTIRGPRIINCSMNSSYEQWKYMPGGSVQDKNYLGEIKWHVSNSVSKYIDFNNENQILGIHVKNIRWLHTVTFPLTASTVEGEVVAKIDITVNIEKVHSNGIAIVCVAMAIVVLLTESTMIMFYKAKNKI